jgi:hypothetical protein
MVLWLTIRITEESHRPLVLPSFGPFSESCTCPTPAVCRPLAHARAMSTAIIKSINDSRALQAYCGSIPTEQLKGVDEEKLIS